MIHLTLSEIAAFVRMNHALISMDYTDQVTIDYNKRHVATRQVADT